MEYLYQCRLVRGDLQQTAWIPERGAQTGKIVELKEDGLFWEVEEVFPGSVSAKALTEKQSMDRRSLLSVKNKGL
jgi:hypothetical protein